MTATIFAGSCGPVTCDLQDDGPVRTQVDRHPARFKGQHLIELRIYTRTNKELFHGHRLKTNLPRMRAAADHIVEYSQHAIMLFQRIYQERKLEE